MNVKKYVVNSKTYKILDSGTIINFDKDSEIVVKLTFNKHNKLRLKFQFITNDSNEPFAKISIIDEGSGNCVIKCEDFSNPAGAGNTTPAIIATYKDRKIFANIQVFPILENRNYTLAYSIYMECPEKFEI